VSSVPDLEHPDRITVGALGEPGRRTFLLQASAGSATVTLKMEKTQVAALGELLGELLSDLPAGGTLPTDLELIEPLEAVWAVSAIELGYDRALDRVVLVVREAEDPEAASARFLVTREQAAALVSRSAELVDAGRPPCPWCGHPLDPAGHSCPRTNGHRPPAL
jgi:uncharacterized repeat protein (TIGR03847 family)